MDKNYEQFRERLQDYEQQPDERLWKNVSKELNKPKHTYLTVSVIVATVLLAGFVGMLALAPEKAEKEIAKTETYPEPTVQRQLADETAIEQNDTPKKNTGTMIRKNETAKENTVIAEVDNQVVETINPTTVTNHHEAAVMPRNQVAGTPKVVSATPPAQKSAAKPANTEIIEPEAGTKTSSDIHPEDIVRTQLFIPNAFTPGESTNNIFKPAYAELSAYRMDIYNSRGVLIFTANDINHGWDGTFNGGDAMQGGYYYIVKFTDTKGNTHTQKGSLMLIR